MIFDDLLNTLVARLQNDAFFSDPEKGVAVIAENRMDLLSEIDVSLSRLGIAMVVAITRVSPDDVGGWQGSVVVTITAQVHEVPVINRAESGSQKTASQCLLKTRGLWDRAWSPNRDVWSPLQFVRYELTEADEANARVIWTIEYNTRTILETVEEVLATETGAPLVTETGEQLLVSPSGA